MSTAVKTHWGQEEWNDEGARRFGKNFSDWKFQCPACKHIQQVSDFEEIKAEPTDAYQMCIGRLTGGRKGPYQCDWAAFGLFRGPWFVTRTDDTTKVIPVFAFAEA